jgi:hypothetical protein
MDNNSYVPLKETNDLIYPDCRIFPSHGGIVPYHLDTLPDRAGWVFERITFTNGGFACPGFDEDTAMATLGLSSGGVSAPETWNRQRCSCRTRNYSASRFKAGAWWEEQNKMGTSRLQWLISALRSDNAFRQGNALHFLRHDYLSITNVVRLHDYHDSIVQFITPLRTSSNESVRQQATLLLKEGLYEFDPG